MKKDYLSTIMVAFVGLSISCGGQTGQTPRSNKPPAEVEPHLKKLEEAKARGEAQEREYTQMQLPELVMRLEADSAKGVEPFNSVAFREARRRGRGAGTELAAYVNKPDRSSFLTLMAVHKTSKEDYDRLDLKLRASILTDALRTSKQFNTWGLPHRYWEDAAKVLIETGEAAEPALRSLLTDTREAPVWGSEEAMEYQKYKYRVKDYAWALLLEIRKQKTEIPVDPEARDRLIQEVGT